MAERQTEFSFHNIQLYKSESLGSGSYGGVCKAQCDGLLCAAKIMHPTLFDLRDPGTGSYLRKFREECHILGLARHPNVVQFLGTYTDPDTRLPVLLMELCDESLTAFLERSPGPLSYHIQVNICHDIALALDYLHSNGLIHRDLTGNNILLIAGVRAKITDFGMSKLATVNPRMTALTLCPGNVLYMSPEALDEAKSYTAKLDVFSFGIIVIQILTRQFPHPTDRFRLVSVPQFQEPLRQEVPETERRKAHLQLIPEAHSLKPLALQCLKKKEKERPSALQLCERLSELKQSSQYRESREQAEHSSEIQQLQLQLRGKTQEAREQQTRITKLENTVDDNCRQLQHTFHCQLQQKDTQQQEKDRQLQQNQHALTSMYTSRLASRDQALERKERKLQQTHQLVSEFQESLQQKNKTITELQRTISEHEKQLEQGATASRDTPPQQEPVETRQTTVAAAQKDISNMRWREGKNAPEEMTRGEAVVRGNTAYFRPSGSHNVYSYQNILGKEQWSHLPDNPNDWFGLAVIDGLLTSVGGRGPTNTLLSLTGEGERKQWSQIFPPMPTPRSNAACVTTKQALVAAGGYGPGCYLDTVEVMNTDTKVWTQVTSLPKKCNSLTAAILGDRLYLAGGYPRSKSVFTCSLPDLLPTDTLGSRLQRQTLSPSQNIWKNACSLPVTWSTLVSFGGHLLAVGGDIGDDKPTSNVYRYDSHADSWTVASQMKKKRYYCLAAALGEDSLVVVGGWSPKLLRSDIQQTNSVQLLI